MRARHQRFAARGPGDADLGLIVVILVIATAYRHGGADRALSRAGARGGDQAQIEAVMRTAVAAQPHIAPGRWRSGGTVFSFHLLAAFSRGSAAVSTTTQRWRWMRAPRWVMGATFTAGAGADPLPAMFGRDAASISRSVGSDGAGGSRSVLFKLFFASAAFSHLALWARGGGSFRRALPPARPQPSPPALAQTRRVKDTLRLAGPVALLRLGIIGMALVDVVSWASLPGGAASGVAGPTTVFLMAAIGLLQVGAGARGRRTGAGVTLQRGPVLTDHGRASAALMARGRRFFAFGIRPLPGRPWRCGAGARSMHLSTSRPTYFSSVAQHLDGGDVDLRRRQSG